MMPTAPRAWHRPVRPWQVALVLGLTVLLWLMFMAAGAGWVMRHGQISTPLNDQPLTMALPRGLNARAEIASPVRAELNIRPLVQLPFDQQVKVSVSQVLNARAQVRSMLPIQTSVHFKGDIAVATQVAMEVPIVAWLPRFTVMLPVSAVVPVDLIVPVNVQVPLVLDMPLQGRLATLLDLPVRTQVSMRLPVSGTVQGRIVNQADFTLLDAPEALALGIRRADITLPLSGVNWVTTDGPARGPASLLLGE